MHVRKPEIAAGVKGEAFVIEPEQVQHRRVQVVDMDFILHTS